MAFGEQEEGSVLTTKDEKRVAEIVVDALRIKSQLADIGTLGKENADLDETMDDILFLVSYAEKRRLAAVLGALAAVRDEIDALNREFGTSMPRKRPLIQVSNAIYTKFGDEYGPQMRDLLGDRTGGAKSETRP